jgi:hypothetical protein
MFYATYAVYASITGWAVLRMYHSAAARQVERSASALTMMALPILLALVLTTLLLNTDETASEFVVWGAAPAAAVFLAGLYPSALPPSSRLALRLVGWSVLAGITLIPAGIALLSPVSALLAHLVPERRWRMEAEDARQ